MKVSIVIPIYNERENIRLLVARINETLRVLDYEVIFVDDGSHDGTPEVLQDVARDQHNISVVILRKNYGQTAAIAAGIDAASGDVIVLMDGDLENDPADIPKLLTKLDEGFDVVSGWREDRWKDEFVTRRFPSQFANWLISKVAGLRLHDYGCTLKAYRADVLKNLRLYGDMHRIMPAYAFWNGARVTEVPVAYKKRVWGVSKYGFGRVKRVLLDLIALKFLLGYATRPLQFFGTAGIFSILFGILAGALAVYYKVSTFHHKDFVETPLPVIMAMLVVVGVLFVMMGLLAEMLMRTYHESQGKSIYSVKEKINL